MTIDRSDGAGQSAVDPTAPQNKSALESLSPDAFVKLFLAQLKNQNPMHPTDSSALLQQMTEITQISSAKDMQKTMNNLATSINTTMTNTQVLEATQMIGKNVEIESKQSQLVKDASGKFLLRGSVLLPGPASNVTVTITDQSGKKVKEINLGPAAGGGLMDFKWDDCLDKDNKALPENAAGLYQISATATINGNSVPLATAGAFKVNSVGLGQGGIVLNLEEAGGRGLDDIIKIL